ncbi:MAG: energy-coupling factor ABC transporter permease [Oscillospiraceae bacterium]|nr:energy-coupling factor ABC transporter permease [Oscillospiraceae bacterium]
MGRYSHTRRGRGEYSLTRVVIAFAQVILGVIFLIYSVPVFLTAMLSGDNGPSIVPARATVLALIGLILVIWGNSAGKRMRRARRSAGMTAVDLATSLAASVVTSQTQTQRPPPTLETASIQTAVPPGTRYILVECEGCGAKNKLLEGTVGECEFCGSYLETTAQPAKAK